MQYLGAVSKMTEWSLFIHIPFDITVIQVYAPTIMLKKLKLNGYDDLQDLLELTPKKRCPLHYRGMECKCRKSRNTWSNRQVWLWSTKWSRAKANRILPKEHTLSKHPFSTMQGTTLHVDIIKWSMPKSDWLHSFRQKWRNSIQSNKTWSWLWFK